MNKDKNSFYKHIYETLKNIRTALNITQNELANRLNITTQQVSKYENGKDKISIEMLYKIAKALQCDIEIFLPQHQYNPSNLLQVSENTTKLIIDNNKYNKNTQAVKILKVFFKLSKDNQDKLLKIANDMLKD